MMKEQKEMLLVKIPPSEERTGIVMLDIFFPTYYLKCKIWGYHGGDYEEGSLLGCYVMLFM
jgi:hypothetical protein